MTRPAIHTSDTNNMVTGRLTNNALEDERMYMQSMCMHIIAHLVGIDQKFLNKLVRIVISGVIYNYTKIKST